MQTPFTKTQFENGLTVMLKEIHTAPIISHWVWYRVGSRDELPGHTGISHWTEHMQFKGTPQFPTGILDKAISRQGGVWNAFTYLDWTTYYETMPAGEIDLAVRLEADRMVNSLFDPQEVASERTVIISEREGNENEPLFRLGEAIQSASFNQHSYRHEIIGEMADLHTIQRDDLYHHYRTYYRPDNAVVAMAGDFDTQQMLSRLQEVFGRNQPGSTPPPHPAQPEPPSTSEQRLTVEGPGETTYLQVSYHAPAAAQDAFFPFTVMDSLLTGPTGLNMFGGGGISNKTSRLYRALVEKELTVSVNGGLQATIDPFLYDIVMTLRPGVSPEKALAALDAEISRLQDNPVPEEEVARAIKQARALFAYGSENITNQAFWLGYAEMFARYEWFLNYVPRLAAITPADVQQMAQTFLQSQNRVVGVYLPNQEKETDR
jgi:zinc protease